MILFVKLHCTLGALFLRGLLSMISSKCVFKVQNVLHYIEMKKNLKNM